MTLSRTTAPTYLCCQGESFLVSWQLGRSVNASFLLPPTHVPLWGLPGMLLGLEQSGLLHTVWHLTREWWRPSIMLELMAPKLICVTWERCVGGLQQSPWVRASIRECSSLESRTPVPSSSRAPGLEISFCLYKDSISFGNIFFTSNYTSTSAPTWCWQ